MIQILASSVSKGNVITEEGSMNTVSPKSLMKSKWTHLQPVNKERHFMVTRVRYDEDQRVELCELEAVMTGRVQAIDWRTLKDNTKWQQGWR